MNNDNILLRSARLKKGWTPQEVSQKVGVSLTTYQRWESGQQMPRLSSLSSLCAVFEMSREELGFPYVAMSEGEAAQKGTGIPSEEQPPRASLHPETLSLAELLINWRAGISWCWQAYMAGAQTDLERLLPTYFAHLTNPTLSAGPYQQQAAGLLAQAYQLRALLDLQRGDFLGAQQNGTQALVFSQLAQDGNLYAASQLRLASIFTAWKRPGAALSAYNEVLRCAHDRVYEISPLLRGWAHAGLADLLASMGREQALQSLEAALLFFPETPQEDPSYVYTLCDSSLLSVYEGRMFLRIGQPQEAWDALAQIDEMKPAPLERMRAEILREKAYAACVLGKKIQSCIYLEAAAKAAQEMQSDLNIGEIYALFLHMLALWGQEPRVRSLAQLFQRI